MATQSQSAKPVDSRVPDHRVKKENTRKRRSGICQTSPGFSTYGGFRLLRDTPSAFDVKFPCDPPEGLATLDDDVDLPRGRRLNRRPRGYNRVFKSAASSR